MAEYKRQNNKANRSVDHDLEKDRNNFFIILILIAVYCYVGVNSAKNDWTTFSFFSYLLKSLGDVPFLIFIVGFIVLYFLSLYIFFQKNSQYRIDLSEPDHLKSSIGVIIVAIFPLFFFISFPLCLLFMGFQLTDGFKLYSKYNKIPTSEEVLKDKFNITPETSIDDIFAPEIKTSSKKRKKEETKKEKKLREYKFENIKDNKKDFLNEIIINNNINNNPDDLAKDYESVEFYLNDKPNDSKTEKLEEKDSIENIINNDKFESIQINESDNIEDIIENESIANSDDSTNIVDNDIPEIKVVETNDFSEIDTFAEDFNKPEDLKTGNDTSDLLSTTNNNKIPEIKPVEINITPTLTSNFDINIKKPEINSIDIISNKPEIKPISTTPVTTTVKETTKETQPSSSLTSSSSLLGSIDISKSILGSSSLTSSLDIKPLSLNTKDEDSSK